MSLITYRPWGLMQRLHQDLDRLMQSQFDVDESQSMTDWIPAVDIKEEENQFVLRADVPGVDPKDIEITMENGVLTLRGERREENRDEANGFRRVERIVGQFFRRFTLPDTADAEGIKARSCNGVLEVVIPKQQKLQPRRITVNAG